MKRYDLKILTGWAEMEEDPNGDYVDYTPALIKLDEVDEDKLVELFEDWYNRDKADLDYRGGYNCHTKLDMKKAWIGAISALKEEAQ